MTRYAVVSTATGELLWGYADSATEAVLATLGLGLGLAAGAWKWVAVRQAA